MTYRKKDKWTKHTYKNKMTLHKTKEKMTSHYKKYAKPYMSPTGTNRTNKGLHIKVQKVYKAVYEPHRDKQNKETKKRKG